MYLNRSISPITIGLPCTFKEYKKDSPHLSSINNTSLPTIQTDLNNSQINQVNKENKNFTNEGLRKITQPHNNIIKQRKPPTDSSIRGKTETTNEIDVLRVQVELLDSENKRFRDVLSQKNEVIIRLTSRLNDDSILRNQGISRKPILQDMKHIFTSMDSIE